MKEQRGARDAEGENSPGRQRCALIVKQQVTHTARAEAMTEAGVRVQHVHVAILAPISLFACVTLQPFVGKTCRGESIIGFRVEMQRFVLTP